MSNQRVQTVMGPVTPDKLGRTLPHEHLRSDFTHLYRRPPKYIAEEFTEFKLEKTGYYRQWPYSSKSNLDLKNLDNDVLCRDVSIFKKYGGGTIVENSSEGLDRSLSDFMRISSKTGVNIVAGTGFYTADTQSYDLLNGSTEELYNHMLKELSVGFPVQYNDFGLACKYKAGFVGEIASSWPLKDFEVSAIKAAGELQPTVGCGVSCHPHCVAAAPFEVARLYLEAGGKVDKLVVSHLDRAFLDTQKLLEFSELGVYCEIDNFGNEGSYDQINNIDIPHDGQRIDQIKALVAEGKEDRILMSHDIHSRHRLVEYGGHGFSHIINNIFPRMKVKEIPQVTIDKITMENPARWLTIEE
ncbi:hypothetical protein ABMA27_004180 [Loxostege sticticalis]|uniref:Phosphotriesterase-related protein n=1 Tax=Loxostege sticticalis TaxID=481309 RepID=A0ABR3HMM7_LOXSC